MGILKSMAGWLDRMAGDGPHQPGEASDFWYEPTGTPNNSGQRVTVESALRVPAAYRCASILAETVAALPKHVKRRTSRGPVPAPDHPLEEIVAYQPNGHQTAVEFWETMVLHCAFSGEAYAEIVPGPRGAVDQLLPLRSGRVTPRRLVNGGVRYDYSDPETGSTRVYLPEELFRVSAKSMDGLRGLKVVDTAAEAIGLAMAADAYAARVFKNNLNIGVVVEHPKKLSEPAQQNLVQALMRRFAGAGNAHRPIVLQEGMKAQKIGQTAEEAQLIEARRWQMVQVANFFGVPLHMLGIEDPNKATIEEQWQNFRRLTLGPLVRRFEEAIRRDLIIAKGMYEVDINLDGLLRGNAEARSNYFSKALGSGGSPAWMTQNEVRVAEGLNELDDPRADVLGVGTNPSTSEPAARAIEDKSPTGRADRVARKFVAACHRGAMRHAGDSDAFRQWASAFFNSQIGFVMVQLDWPKEVARLYCTALLERLVQADDPTKVVSDWESNLAGETVEAMNRVDERKDP